MARKRGAQFMRALQDEFPGLMIFSLRLLSDFQDGSPFSQRLLGARDPREACGNAREGVVGAASRFPEWVARCRFSRCHDHDGNEDANYYTSALDFYLVLHALRHDALALVTPESRRKYSVQVQIGQALAVDYITGRWGDLNHFPDYLRKQALELTPVERARWFEHNVYYALITADEYVWCWSEQQNWRTGDKVPPGFEEAIRSARRKYESGKPLGFTVEEMLRQAQTKVKPKEGKGI